MMDTVLNIGLNDETVKALVQESGNERFAWDSYRRFVQMYGDVVLGVQKRPGEDEDPFEAVIEEVKHENHEEDADDSKLNEPRLLRGAPGGLQPGLGRPPIPPRCALPDRDPGN